ncbi:marine proteobacterial sortase target protein [Shewanella colwelliana]|uniref:marine proteobacterial sortase target protein n=1 Tax=Shewanella colwelliana TaxID=23 RepID=UPI0022AFC978|nr:marine proteobacterial sortase target protein [Shewanella colwelliana]MCZ4336420.1 marine proteobacterial sortase target protein [Shewanella colwelliana]
MLLTAPVWATPDDDEPLGMGYLSYTPVDGSLSQSPQIGLPINTDVEMQISGWLNRVDVKQVFVNHSDQWLNGTYQFPLPQDAAVDAMTLTIGTRVIVGEVKTKGAAKKQFEQAKAAGKKASLLTQQRPNIFTSQVANLAPGERVVVEISYQQIVRYRQGEFSLRFPMAITPRYSPLSAKASAVTLPQNAISDALEMGVLSQHLADSHDNLNLDNRDGTSLSSGKVNIKVNLDAGMPLLAVTTPYHQMSRSEQHESSIGLRLTKVVNRERDFVLRWQPALNDEPTALAFSQSGKTHSSESTNEVISDYGLVMLMPPLDESRHKMARELILVIDTSGSMNGESILQAKSALRHALAGLSPVDRFNIIAFDSSVSVLSPTPLAVTATNLGLAHQFVSALSADGGTEMAPALATALASKNDTEERGNSALRQVVFITDGAVTNEQGLFNLIAQHIGRSRLFTIGIGAAPNGYFMERAAQVGRGTYTYIGNLSEVGKEIGLLLEKIENPVISNVEIALSDGSIPDYWPVNIGDLYANEPILVAVRLRAKQHQFHSDELIVSGELDGQFWQRRVAITRNSQAAGLDLVWARKKIATLLLSKNSSNHELVKRQVTQVALAYHLVSPYTSLVAVDRTLSRPSTETVSNASANTMLPMATQAKWPKTGSGSRLYLAIGGLMMLLLLVYWLSYAPYVRRYLINHFKLSMEVIR